MINVYQLIVTSIKGLQLMRNFRDNFFGVFGALRLAGLCSLVWGLWFVPFAFN